MDVVVSAEWTESSVWDWRTRAGFLYLWVVSWSAHGAADEYDWYVMTDDEDKCHERALRSSSGSMTLEEAKQQCEAAAEEIADGILRGIQLIGSRTGVASVRGAINNLLGQVDRLVGDLVLLHAESGAPAPPDFQVAAKRIRTLRLIHEALLRDFPEIEAHDSPRTRLSGEVQALLKQLEG